MQKHISTALLSTLVMATLPTLSHAGDTVNLQRLQGPNGEVLTSSANFQRMSGNGRFMLYSNNFNHTLSNFFLFMQDMKTGVSVQIETSFAPRSTGEYGISENGQLVAYYDDASNLYVKDMASGTRYSLGDMSSANRVLLTNSGDVFYIDNDSVNGGKYLAVTNIHTLNTDILANADVLQMGGISQDGRHLVYSQRTFGGAGNSAFYQAMHLDRDSAVLTQITDNGYEVNNITISGNGQVIGVSYAGSVADNVIELFNSADFSLTAYSKDTLKVDNPLGLDTQGGLALSYDGRYASFKANMAQNHPDYDQVTNFTYDRIFRLDTATGTVLTISEPWDEIESDNFVNVGTTISNDGRLVSFAANAKDLLPTTPQSVEEPYHATVHDFSADYLFVGLPNSDQNWQHYSNMSLIADHTWQGVLQFDGVGTDAFKFDLGGQFSGANGTPYQPTANWALNYGDNNADGIADQGGNNILITEGAGDYRITFNSQSKVYSVEKIIAQGNTVDVLFSCFNGTTYSGQSIYAIGNVDALGNWDKALAVKLEPTSYPTWTSTIAVPANSQIEWKCLKREENDPNAGVVWQGGSNNPLDTNTSTQSSGSF